MQRVPIDTFIVPQEASERKRPAEITLMNDIRSVDDYVAARPKAA
jgi:hypothetical protein